MSDLAEHAYYVEEFLRKVTAWEGCAEDELAEAIEAAEKLCGALDSATPQLPALDAEDRERLEEMAAEKEFYAPKDAAFLRNLASHLDQLIARGEANGKLALELEANRDHWRSRARDPASHQPESQQEGRGEHDLVPKNCADGLFDQFMAQQQRAIDAEQLAERYKAGLERIANTDWSQPPADMPDEMARAALDLQGEGK